MFWLERKENELLFQVILENKKDCVFKFQRSLNMHRIELWIVIYFRVQTKRIQRQACNRNHSKFCEQSNDSWSRCGRNKWDSLCLQTRLFQQFVRRAWGRIREHCVLQRWNALFCYDDEKTFFVRSKSFEKGIYDIPHLRIHWLHIICNLM